MAIKDWGRDQFVATLQANVSASEPVRSIEHLHGRSNEMQRIDEALQAKGRHVFVYGDRGVGKSSLAAAAATQYQSADRDFISVPCGTDTTFYGTIEWLARNIVKEARGSRSLEASQTLDLKFFKTTVTAKERDPGHIKIDSMQSAIDAIKLVAQLHSKLPVVVVDEFDQIESAADRQAFAGFLKGLGDSGVDKIKFIFTGVASSLDELLQAHASSYRQLHTEKLGRVDWSARMEIVRQAAEAFDLTVEDEVLHLIARMSNGFPYYVHLITEKLLWEAFRVKEIVANLDMEIFKPALAEAIRGIAPQLQAPYDKATLHRSPDYRDIVWATADSESDFRSVEAMFRSYLRIHRQFYGEDPAEEDRPLDSKKFGLRLSSLRTEKLGNVLVPYLDRKGLYSFRENILRGFVAMKAFEAGVELRGDVPDEPKVPTAMGRVTRQNTASIFGGGPPKGIKYRGEKRDEDEDPSL